MVQRWQSRSSTSIHFKRINGTHGRAMGDTVIRHVALRAKAALRDEGSGRQDRRRGIRVHPPAGRVRKTAEIVAERVRKAVEAGTAAEEDVPDELISVGLAIYEGEADIEELLHRADKALYGAKREGTKPATTGGEGWGVCRSLTLYDILG